MLPKPDHYVTCDLCKVQVNPLVARYLWVQLGWRGRPSGRGPGTVRAVFCGPHGQLVQQLLEPLLTREQRDGLRVKVTT